jgi:hypothetical protein
MHAGQRLGLQRQQRGLFLGGEFQLGPGPHRLGLGLGRAAGGLQAPHQRDGPLRRCGRSVPKYPITRAGSVDRATAASPFSASAAGPANPGGGPETPRTRPKAPFPVAQRCHSITSRPRPPGHRQGARPSPCPRPAASAVAHRPHRIGAGGSATGRQGKARSRRSIGIMPRICLSPRAPQPTNPSGAHAASLASRGAVPLWKARLQPGESRPPQRRARHDQGSIPALVTPFKNGELDLVTLKKLVDWQIAEGSTGLVPVGTTGESPTLSHAEHQR